MLPGWTGYRSHRENPEGRTGEPKRHRNRRRRRHRAKAEVAKWGVSQSHITASTSGTSAVIGNPRPPCGTPDLRRSPAARTVPRHGERPRSKTASGKNTSLAAKTRPIILSLPVGSLAEAFQTLSRDARVDGKSASDPRGMGTRMDAYRARLRRCPAAHRHARTYQCFPVDG